MRESEDEPGQGAVLPAVTEIVRTLCSSVDEPSLRAAAGAVLALPGVDGVVLDFGGVRIEQGSTDGPAETLVFDEEGGGVLRLAGPACEPGSATRPAFDLLALVLGGLARQARAAGALRERESTSRAVLESSLDAIVTADAAGVIREFNPAAERIFGHAREEVVGRTLAEVLVPDRMRAQHSAGLARYARTGEPHVIGQRLEMPAMRADGEELVVELVISPTHVDGHLGFTGFLRDVTQARATQRELESATTRLRTLIASLNAGVLLEDETRHIVVTNQAFCDLFAIPAPPAALLGADCTRAAEDSKHLFADPDAFVRSVDERLADRRLVTDEELVMADGRILDRDYVPVFGGQTYLGHLWVYRDVTERRRAEKRLLDQNRLLADVGRRRDEFVATVSHELRTPLTSVLAFTEILADPRSGPLTTEQRTYLEAIERGGKQLLHLGNDLLTLLSAESDGLTLEPAPFDAVELVRAVVADHRGRADQRSVSLTATTPDRIVAVGDVARLRQVLDNVVGNAVKYTEAGGTVEVEATDGADGWGVTVTDSGIGIPAAEQDRMFTSFFRASNARGATTSGTGLGLVVSRAIVELHGGSMTLTSEEDVGTTVVVRLPLAADDGAAP